MAPVLNDVARVLGYGVIIVVILGTLGSAYESVKDWIRRESTDWYPEWNRDLPTGDTLWDRVNARLAAHVTAEEQECADDSG